MRIVLLGAPGAGKGTQCRRVAEQYGVVHLSSGDILRAERAEGSDLGRQAQGYMDSGQLVPDELIVEMMAGAIAKAPDAGYVLDGFPRTVNQARQLNKLLSADGRKIDAVLNLKIDDEIILSRMTGRRSCPECGAVYHTENLKPKVEGKCDSDGTELVQRPDDKPDVVRQRLSTYHEQTEPVIDYYKKNGCVYEIEAGRSADEVSAMVFETLNVLSGNLV